MEGYQEEPGPQIAAVGSAASFAGATANAGNEVETETDNAKVEYYAFHQGKIRRASETG